MNSVMGSVIGSFMGLTMVSIECLVIFPVMGLGMASVMSSIIGLVMS